MSTYDPLTLAGIVGRYASEQPDFKVLTVEGANVRPDEVRTYAELWEQAQKLAAGLQARGVKQGDMIGTLLQNHAELVDLMVASSLLGTVFVPIDPRTKGEKLAYMLSAAKCSVIMAADYAVPSLLEVRDQLPEIKLMVGLQTDEGKATAEQLTDVGIVPWSELASTPAASDYQGSAADNPMELIYTSGTTGDPKGIVLTHRRYCETSLVVPKIFGYADDDCLYSGLSLTHANAQVLTLGAALANAIPCVLSRKFTKSRLWDICRKYGCTTFTLLGGMTTAVYADPPKADDADNPVRFVISAGMPKVIWEDFAKRFDLKITEFYGAAEGGMTINPSGMGPVGSIGKSIPTLKYRIVDEEGNDCPPGTPGELWFRHADDTPFKVEYFGNPEASEKKCADGWIHMGDVVIEDEQGWMYFQYRQGSGIRRNGDFINPSFIEKAIAESPEIDDVYVYGIPAANNAPGEKDPVAAIVPKNGRVEDFDAQAVFKLCREKLEANFVPAKIQVLSQIPKTASEKPQDRFLIEALESNPATVYTENR